MLDLLLHREIRLCVIGFVQGFMTGALQTYARKTKIPIDTLTFRTQVLAVSEKEVEKGPENGVYVYGLYLQGARWDTKVRQGPRARTVVLLWCTWLLCSAGCSMSRWVKAFARFVCACVWDCLGCL